MNGNHVKLETPCSWSGQTLTEAGDQGEDSLYLDHEEVCSAPDVYPSGPGS